MNELKPCPFCKTFAGFSDMPPYEGHTGYVRCNFCGAKTPFDTWNARPIEDALHARIAELEHDLTNKEIEYTDLWDDALAFQSRIAELEAENERLKDAWFVEETICPDGSLKPKVSTLLSRIAELEAAQLPSPEVK